MFESILRVPDMVTVRCDLGEWYAAPQTAVVTKEDISILFSELDHSLTVQVQAQNTGVSLIRLKWKLKIPLSGMVLGDALERGYGDLGWSSMIPWKSMPWYFLIHKDSCTAGYGVKVRAGSFAFWQADPTSVTLTLDVRNGGMGTILKGRILKACEIVFETYHGITSFEAAKTFCHRMCSDPLLPPYPVYGSNNWYYAYGTSSQEEILADTDYLMELTRDFENPPFMVIDDCWQLHRSKDYIGGPWIPNSRFPDMKALCDKIHAKGARGGIWVRFLLDRSETIPKDWRLSHNGCLDPSHPDVISHIKEDIARIASWGYELIKHDFSTFDLFGKWGFQMLPFVTDSGWHFYDQSRTSAEIVVDFYCSILEEAKKTGILILGCNTIGHLLAGLAHINRTGDDTSGLLWERTVRYGVNTLAFRMPQHKTFYDVDADCLGITDGIPWELNRLWGQALAISGTPMFVSVKPGLLTKEQNAEVSSFLQLASKQSQTSIPCDWENTTQPLHWKVGDVTYSFPWYEEIGLRTAKPNGIIWERYSKDNLFIGD